MNVGFSEPGVMLDWFFNQEATFLEAILNAIPKGYKGNTGLKALGEMLEYFSERITEENAENVINSYLDKNFKEEWRPIKRNLRKQDKLSEGYQRFRKNIEHMAPLVSEKTEDTRLMTKKLLEIEDSKEQIEYLEKLGDKVTTKYLETINDKRKLLGILSNLEKIYPDKVNFEKINKKIQKEMKERGVVLGNISSNLEIPENVEVIDFTSDKVYDFFRRLPTIKKSKNLTIGLKSILPKVGRKQKNLTLAMDINSRQLNPVVLSLLSKNVEDVSEQITGLLNISGFSEDAYLRHLNKTEDKYKNIKNLRQLKADEKQYNDFLNRFRQLSQIESENFLIVSDEDEEAVLALLNEVFDKDEKLYRQVFYPGDVTPPPSSLEGSVPIDINKLKIKLDDIVDIFEDSEYLDDIFDEDNSGNLIIQPQFLVEYDYKEILADEAITEPKFINRVLEALTGGITLRDQSSMSIVETSTRVENKNDTALILSNLVLIVKIFHDTSIANAIVNEVKKLAGEEEGSSAEADVEELGDAFGLLEEGLKEFKTSVVDEFRSSLQKIADNPEEYKEVFDSSLFRHLVRSELMRG